ncbi:acyl-CoA dehydrogenase family protein [Streptomyces sp. NEAU-Y11]|uniref:acyl-CoA dehydrogenase family protein n=1 Tax=Streptomyces cucumeris TaxID=2962890 RepID=UPI0020C8E445|nr:acyl-CoA dehydrogenase family protein [Streptomyces sp. NEAU-Y11]MCP9212564.1 acyl-CoA dehydrogenase family protein [Streptomyces sp. NEAU-Y11]
MASAQPARGARTDGAWTADRLRSAVQDFVSAHDPATTDPVEFLGALFDAGLAWVHFPPGHGGLGAPRALQSAVDDELTAAGAPPRAPGLHTIGLGMAAPVLLTFGDEAQKKRFLRPLFTREEVWCQLFSEPGAGSDLAALATRAEPDEATGDWVVNGQKVWTSVAHEAHWGLLVARTGPELPKHQGLSYFLIDMRAPGVEVRPLRQATGEAEFNEVFLTDVRIPDTHRVGAVGDGWKVASGTLMNERVAIGAGAMPREGGLAGGLARLWRERPELRTPGLHSSVVRAWVDAEALRLTAERLRQQLAAGHPGPEGSAAKISFAGLNQRMSGLALDLLGEEGLGYDDWTFRRPEPDDDFSTRSYGFFYLRTKGNSIEGGTTEVLRNVIAERVLGLPPEPRTDKTIPWKDLPR